jgi:trk system potassium uptake protein TrkH
MIALMALAALTLGMTVLEPVGENPLFTTENILYEAASALGTSGLTTGITPYLTVSSKLLLIVAMFMGRVGPLSLTLALSRRLSRTSKLHIEYPEDHIIVG